MPTFPAVAMSGRSDLEPIISRMATHAVCLMMPGAGPTAHQRPFKETDASIHLLGLHKLGMYPIARGESTTRVAVFDFDDKDGTVGWTEMVRTALAVMNRSREKGLAPVPFRSSGGRGIHLWFIWEHPQDARSVRVLMRSILADVGFTAGTKGVANKQVEIFPAQDSIAPDGTGNPIFIPLGGNTKSVPLHPTTLEVLA